MSTIHRPPLGSSTVFNLPVQAEKPVHRSKSGIHPDPENKLKQALNEASHQRRKRAEAEGQAEAWQRESEAFKQDLEKARSKLARRDETIRTLAETRPQAGSDPEIDKKLQDLVQRHSGSKAKYETQLASLKGENSDLRATSVQLEQSHTKDTAAIAELRRANLLAETENNNLKRELESLRHSRTHDAAVAGSSRHIIRDLEDEKTRSEAENHKLEREVKRLHEAMEDKAGKEHLDSELGRLQAKLHKVVQEKEGYQNTIGIMTEGYAVLYRNTVSKDQYAALLEEHRASKATARSWKTKAEVLKGELSITKEENKDFKERLRSAHDDRCMLERIIWDIREEKQRLVYDTSTSIASPPSHETIEPLESAFDPNLLLEYTVSHVDLSTTYLQHQINYLRSEQADLSLALSETTASLTSSQGSVTALQRSLVDLQTRHTALEQSHSPCGGALGELREALGKSLLNEEDRTREIEELRKERQSVEARAQSDREALKRANEVVMRAKMAEDALDEEIHHLRNAYLNAAKYEALYDDLQEQQAIILSREAAAIDEAEKLGMQNAELLGHVSEGQRISYVEGVRREMAAIKQELAATRHYLNKANDKIRALESEVDSYKSIGSNFGLDANLEGSTRTRVVRRQPEGGMLVSSTRGSGRSVSGPAGR
ncbi:hypothetical protein IAR55_004133 [Kwoniella newhampshirensis]|uniref:Hyaluronan-mediated motility receptor C-terminal domain-containing protein n=1 Tax=Kwoniella newhampshirensis TaxID=1651941 RepID=A0AAW0YYV2_9TREE